MSDNNIPKFQSLNPTKRDRIINAAMKEFQYGYKRASTDAIVKEAGISKGLLFHYFGTKERLYEFLLRYTNDLSRSEYQEMLDQGQRDILEVIWQSALLQRDLIERYPYISEFSNGAMNHREDIPAGMEDIFIKEGEADFDELLKKCDTSLFREDIDAQKAADLIFWAIGGCFDYAKVKGLSFEEFLEYVQVYLDIFRRCFYKDGENL